MSGEPKDEYQIRPGGKLEKWFNFYLDRKNIETYMNATASAKAAGYNCSSYSSFGTVGQENMKRLATLIKESLGDCGVTRGSVKALLAESMRATKTLFINRGDEVEEREVMDHQSRVPALRLAAKVLGMEAPNKHEHSGPGGQQLEVTVKPGMTVDEAAQAYAKLVKDTYGQD